MKQNLLKSVFLTLVLAMTTSATVAQSHWPQFRGPNRDGKSLESGLLKQWPEDGPKLLRTFSGFGGGFSTPVIAGDMKQQHSLESPLCQNHRPWHCWGLLAVP